MTTDNDEFQGGLPDAPVAEKAVLSLIMKDAARWYPAARGEGIGEDHFHMPARRMVWRQMASMVEQGKEVELLAFVQEAQLAGTIDAMGGPSAVADLLTFVGGLRYDVWPQYIEQLREGLARRKAVLAGHELSKELTGEDALRLMQDAVDQLSGSLRGPSRSVEGKDLSLAFLDSFQEAYSSGDLPGISTGYPELDQVSGGMRPGQLIVVAGLPSQGKSAMMYEIADSVVSQGERVAIFSLEMSKEEVVARIVAVRGRTVPFEHIMKPKKATKMDLQVMQRVLGQIKESKISVCDDADQTIDKIAGEAMRLRDLHGGLKMVVVDYLQLVDGEKARGETREQEIARVSRGLKAMAKRLNCVVVTGSQLNDKGQTRESRAIDQDADWLLTIVSDGVKIVKMRNAKRDHVLELYLNGAYQRFVTNRPD